MTQVLSVYTHTHMEIQDWGAKTNWVIYISRAAQTHKAFLFVTLLSRTTGAGWCVIWSKNVHSDEE